MEVYPATLFTYINDSMELTRTEARVVARLRSKRVDTMNHLCQQPHVSHMSVVRALKKHGYFTSINHNASYYTLHDIPHFDEDGLWSYRDICFSSHRTLAKTLVALVQNSTAGLSVAQLQQRLNKGQQRQKDSRQALSSGNLLKLGNGWRWQPQLGGPAYHRQPLSESGQNKWDA